MTTDTEKGLFDVSYYVGKAYRIQVMATDEMDAVERAKQIWAVDPSQFTDAGDFEDHEADYAELDTGS